MASHQQWAECNWELWSRKELCQIVWQLRILFVTICFVISHTSKKLCIPYWFHAKMGNKKKQLCLNLNIVYADKFLFPLRTQDFPSCISLFISRKWTFTHYSPFIRFSSQFTTIFSDVTVVTVKIKTEVCR